MYVPSCRSRLCLLPEIRCSLTVWFAFRGFSLQILSSTRHELPTALFVVCSLLSLHTLSATGSARASPALFGTCSSLSLQNFSVTRRVMLALHGMCSLVFHNILCLPVHMHCPHCLGCVPYCHFALSQLLDVRSLSDYLLLDVRCIIPTLFVACSLVFLTPHCDFYQKYVVHTVWSLFVCSTPDLPFYQTCDARAFWTVFVGVALDVPCPN